jgi:TorA maturation chaperone TorD
MNAPGASSANSLLARAVLYRLLALGFHEPAQPLLDLLTSPEEHSALQAAAAHLDEAAGSRSLGPAISGLLRKLPPEGWDLRSLRVEYTRLLIGPGPGYCAPYQSVYDRQRPKEDWGTVQGPSALAMEDALAAEGLIMDLGRQDLADHAAVELEFMLYLLRRALEPGDAPDPNCVARSERFLLEHLAPWLPHYGQQIVEKAEHPLYKYLGRLLTALIEQDLELLSHSAQPAAG